VNKFHNRLGSILVGITAFTSQANRAYEVAAHFRRLGVPVVMGGKGGTGLGGVGAEAAAAGTPELRRGDWQGSCHFPYSPWNKLLRFHPAPMLPFLRPHGGDCRDLPATGTLGIRSLASSRSSG
jgi:hypothetical protein